MRDTNHLLARVSISPLHSLPPTVREQANKFLYGNKTCSLENMNTTCFAAEHCAMSHNPTFPTRFDEMASETLVAHTSDYEFVGCVCTGPLSVYPLSIYPPTVKQGTVLFNLCVSNVHQGGGVGRRLVQEIRTRVKGDLYLFILQNGDRNDNPQINNVMQMRVQRLKTTYGRIGCKCVKGGLSEKFICFQVA